VIDTYKDEVIFKNQKDRRESGLKIPFNSNFDMTFEDLNLIEKYPKNQTTLRINELQSA
jgi:hypothetical protein